jgi:hypothetical protein
VSESFADILKKLSKKSPVLNKIYIISQLREKWSDVIKDTMLQDTWVQDYEPKSRTLVVGCSNNYEMQEVILNKLNISEESNRILNESLICEVRAVKRRGKD